MTGITRKQKKQQKQKKQSGGDRNIIKYAISIGNIELLENQFEPTENGVQSSNIATINEPDPVTGETYLQMAINVYQKDHHRQLLRSRNSSHIENNTHLTNGRKVIKYLISKGAILNENDFKDLPDTVFVLLKELLNRELIKQKFRTPINRDVDPRLLTYHYGSKSEPPTNNSSLKKNIESTKLFRLAYKPNFRFNEHESVGNKPTLEDIYQSVNDYWQGGPAVEGIGTRLEKRGKSRKTRKSRK